MSDENNVTVVRVKSGKIRHSSRAVRAINEIRLSGIIWNAARHYFETNPCDLVIYYSPTIFWSQLVRKLKSLTGCGSYLILRDLFPQWALDAGLLTRYGLAYWFFRFHEVRLYRTADVIGVQSPANLEYFTGSSLNGRYNLEVLFNWTNVANRPSTPPKLRIRLGLLGKIIFVYGGNLGVAQDIDNILRLAANMSEEKDVVFLLLGEGSEFDRIKLEIERRAMMNVVMHPAVPTDEYLDIVAECDVGLITLRRDLKTQNFPGKLLSYMELQKPVLASINPGNDLSAIIRSHNAGLVCINGEDEVFHRHALTLARDHNLRLHMGMNAYKLLQEKFDVSTAVRQILGRFVHKNADA
ncbi:MAG: glycosyltransferase family 4 protein [Candidatus Lindowbacteria bacterium]|nr:glycosyltransferase family 4 protein [Candidatus Lindowbacteria bacterium]